MNFSEEILILSLTFDKIRSVNAFLMYFLSVLSTFLRSIKCDVLVNRENDSKE